jgi:uncharacterized membrane protein YbhN (UPF0104 family)
LFACLLLALLFLTLLLFPRLLFPLLLLACLLLALLFLALLLFPRLLFPLLLFACLLALLLLLLLLLSGLSKNWARRNNRQRKTKRGRWRRRLRGGSTPGRTLCESGIGKQKESGEYNHAQDHKRLLSNSGVANSLVEELQDALPTGLTNALYRMRRLAGFSGFVTNNFFR